MSHREPGPIRRARLARGLSIERTAVAAGISGGWLRWLERDQTLLTRRVAERLAPVLGVEVGEILQSPPARSPGDAP